MTEKSIINLGDLSKPATRLIEKVSSAIGVLYNPTRKVREAKADVEVKKIKKLAALELNEEIEERAITRLIDREVKNQENIEAITYEAIEGLEEKAKPEDIDEDWISHFFEKCKTVSDAQMQKLWAKVLSGEANKSGSFSRRTIEFLATMDKVDANTFTNICRYNILFESNYLMIDINENEYFNSKEIFFTTLTYYQDIGLVNVNHVSDFRRQSLPKVIKCEYFGKPIIFEFEKTNDNSLPLGNVLFSKLGRELYTLSGATPGPTFLSFLKNYYMRKGIKLIF